MMRLVLALFLLLPIHAVRAEMPVERALADAIATFERAAPNLPASAYGVDIGAYGDALRSGQFQSAYWGGAITRDISVASPDDALCTSFAAYVRLPPRDGRVALVLCPQFATPGADALRRLTILHEMVHVVAGPDECRAMSFAAWSSRSPSAISPRSSAIGRPISARDPNSCCHEPGVAKRRTAPPLPVCKVMVALRRLVPLREKNVRRKPSQGIGISGRGFPRGTLLPEPIPGPSLL